MEMRVNNVCKTYATGTHTVTALTDISFTVGHEFVSVMGPSGCGKSTLLHIVSGLDSPDTGNVVIAGKNVSTMSEDELSSFRLLHIGLVFQEFYLFTMLTALENVLLPLKFSPLDKKDKINRAQTLLEEVGLKERITFKPRELSMGEQQRVAIARALANDPGILLADEPTGNLDSARGIEIMNIFKRLKNGGKTIFMVTHNKEMSYHSDRVLKMKDGFIVGEEYV